MASLMKKLFDTMPLAGVEGAVRYADVGFGTSTIGRVSRHLRCHKTLTPFSVTSPRPGEQTLKQFEGKWHRIPIWGYHVTASPTRVKQVTCRVRNDDFNNYVVLDELEWGYAPIESPTSFREAVQITFQGNPIELPLSEEYRLMTFSTQDGQNDAGVHWLWQLDALHDRSLLHVFAYDVHRTRSEVISLKSPKHPDRVEVDALVARCEELNSVSPTDARNAAEFLFKDNLWDTASSKAPPTGKVPEDVDLSLRPVRILVALSLTVCRERDDFQPGRPMGVGRLYPHVMVVATAALDRVDAGLRFSRPQKTTLLDGAHCGCDEMLADIGGLLVADSNEDGMTLRTPGAPLIYIANLFNYYVPDPALDPALKNTALPVIRRSKPHTRNEVGYVERDCSRISFLGRDDNARRVTKLPRQGYFDNIHLAPRMTVKTKIDSVSLPESVPGIARVNVKFPGYSEWKMDSTLMAPFCAHDCFHMHWRWSNNGNTEGGTYGWGPQVPHEEVGSPMVPHNQDVYITPLSQASFSYLANAFVAKADRWQPFCHHGAGYGLSVGPLVNLARAQVGLTDTMDFRSGSLPTLGDWALFYWRLRYELRAVKKLNPDGTIGWDAVVRERFRFVDRAKAFDL